MTHQRANGRFVFSVSVQPNLHELVMAAASREDIPASVWIRNAIKQKLIKDGPSLR